MAALLLYLHHLLSFYISVTTIVIHHLLSATATILRRLLPHIDRSPPITPFVETLLSLYLRFFCHLSPCTFSIDHDGHFTTMHLWSPTRRRPDKPNLVMIHGYGANSKWQFVFQVGPLANAFNIYVPDLIFFGKSVTEHPERSESFQARCLVEALNRLGVNRCSVYGLSYGGYVGYRMAEMWPEMVEKLVIVSSGIGCTEDQKMEHLKKVGCNMLDFLLPEKPEDVRLLMDMTIYKFNPGKWTPDFVLQEFIDVMCRDHRQGKQELVEHLLANKSEFHLQLSQEILLIWGDKDKIFPLSFAQYLQRRLGRKARLEVLKDAGHAANIDAPFELNALIKAFVSSS